MGNRGGRIHDPGTQTLLSRRWASRRWICCVTEFKNRHRKVMGEGYTELFFLDEVTALGYGHRPCFECRREAAVHFSNLWKKIHNKNTSRTADEMDRMLHFERTSNAPVITINSLKNLPDAACIKHDSCFFMKRGNHLVKWSGEGYSTHIKFTPEIDKKISLITPKTILSVLEAGYSPVWHPSIEG